MGDVIVGRKKNVTLMKIWFSNLFLNPAFTFDSVQSALHAKDSLISANNDSGCSMLKIEYAKVKLQNIQIHKSRYLFKKTTTLHLVNPENLKIEVLNITFCGTRCKCMPLKGTGVIFCWNCQLRMDFRSVTEPMCNIFCVMPRSSSSCLWMIWVLEECSLLTKT